MQLCMTPNGITINEDPVCESVKEIVAYVLLPRHTAYPKNEQFRYELVVQLMWLREHHDLPEWWEDLLNPEIVKWWDSFPRKGENVDGESGVDDAGGGRDTDSVRGEADRPIVVHHDSNDSSDYGEARGRVV